MTTSKRGRPRLYHNPPRPGPVIDSNSTLRQFSGYTQPLWMAENQRHRLPGPGTASSGTALTTQPSNEPSSVSYSVPLNSPQRGHEGTSISASALNESRASTYQPESGLPQPSEGHVGHSSNLVDVLSNQFPRESILRDYNSQVLPSPAPSDDNMQEQSSNVDRPPESSSENVDRSPTSSTEFTRLQQLAAQYGGVAGLEKHLAHSAMMQSSLSPQIRSGQAVNEQYRSRSSIASHPPNSQTYPVSATSEANVSGAPVTQQPQSFQGAHSPQGHSEFYPFNEANFLNIRRMIIRGRVGDLHSLGKAGSVEDGRLGLLSSACEAGDFTFLAIHQLYCFEYQTKSAGLPSHISASNDIFTALETLIVHNRSLSHGTLSFFANFPVPMDQLQGLDDFARIMGRAMSVLDLLNKNLASFKANWTLRQSAPLPEAIRSDFKGLKSPTLEVILFTFMVRTALRPPHFCTCIDELQKTFKACQVKERDLLRQGLPNPTLSTTRCYIETDNIFKMIYYKHHHQLHDHAAGRPSMAQGSPSLPSTFSIPADHLHTTSSQRPSSHNQHLPQVSQGLVNHSPDARRGMSNQRSRGGPGRNIRNFHQDFRPIQQQDFHSSPNTISPSSVTTQSSNPSFHNPGVPGPIPSHYATPPGYRQSQPHQQSNHHKQSSRPRPDVPLISMGTSEQPRYQPQPNLLFPPKNYVRPQLSNPPPGGCALHQSHLRDPLISSIQTETSNSETEKGNWLSILSEFALEPRALLEDRVHIEGAFIISEEKFRSIPLLVPGERGAPPTRKINPGSVYVRLRCIKAKSNNVLESEWAVIETAWPNNIAIEINGKPVEIRRKYLHGKDLPVDITSSIQPDLNRIGVALMQDSKDKSDSSFYHIAVEIIEYTNQASFKSIVEKKAPIDTGERIRSRRSNEDDDIEILSTDIVIRVVDPYTSEQVIAPVRGESCAHYECFDLDVFLQTRNGYPSRPEQLKCPICGRDCRPQHLVMDSWLAGVINELKQMGREDVSAITVDEHASWRIKEEDPVSGETGDGTGKMPSREISARRSAGPGNSEKVNSEPVVIELD